MKVYLDNAASTKVDDKVAKEVQKCIPISGKRLPKDDGRLRCISSTGPSNTLDYCS